MVHNSFSTAVFHTNSKIVRTSSMNLLAFVLLAMNYAEDRLDRKALHSNEDTLREAHGYLKENELSIKAKGHELAGKTLRDAGLSPQATFHYGMAWLMTCCDDGNDTYLGGEDHGDVGGRDKAVGDYAQMVELAGFPEVAVLSLLYSRLGGRSFIKAWDVAHDQKDDNRNHVENIFCETEKDRAKRNCGCGIAACGISPCFVPSQMTSSTLFQEILDAFQSLEMHLQNPSREESYAADLIESVSKATQKKNPVKIKSQTPLHIPPQLRFWEETNKTGDAAITARTMSHLLQILLTKILYSAPIGSSFLYLACESIRHLSISLPASSALGRRMAQTHKSHWAYYILIYKVVLGERVKKHRRGTAVPYHYPIWDIIHSLDQRKNVSGHLLHESSRNIGGDAIGVVDHLKNVVRCLSLDSTYDDKMVQFAPPMCLPHSTTEKFIFAIGDSHVLSVAWQTLHISNENRDICRTIVPCPITGLKAWHTRSETQFFTKHNLECCLQRLPKSCRSILLSAGEIDCREGIGGSLLEGYYNDCDDAVRNTVKVYIEAVTFLAIQYDLQILLLPVAPHAYRSEKNGRALGRGLRRQRMLLWNDTMRELCCTRERDGGRQHVFLLDYEEGLRVKNEESPVGFVLNKNFNADFTHMNSAFLPLLEKSIVESNFDWDLF